VKSADQVALEAGNSPSIIFKHYRELTSEEQAEKWFSIMPKEGQWENTFSYDHPSILFFSVSVFSTSAFTENLPLFPFLDRLPSVFSALGEKAIS
jgi:hypothetical protein